MTKLINKLYILLLLHAAYLIYDAYTNIEEKKAKVNASIETLKRKVDKQKREKKLISEYVKDVEAKKQEIEEVAQQIEAIQRRFPQKLDDAANFKAIKDIADDLKIRELNIQPAGEISNGFYITKQYNINAKATYLQFLLLLERVADSERLLNVNGITMKRIKTKRRTRYESLDIVATIETYRHNPRHKEDRGIREIEKRIESKPVPRAPRRKRKVKNS